MAETKARVLQDRVLKFRHPTRIFAQSRKLVGDPHNKAGLPNRHDRLILPSPGSQSGRSHKNEKKEWF